MSRSNTQQNWLLPFVILGCLCLTASNFSADPPASNARAARSGALKPSALAALPPHLGVAASFSRHRYIVQSQSAEMARRAVSQAGGLVTGDLSVIRAVAAQL